MPGWSWFLVGMATGLISAYLWLAWYLRDVFR